MDTLKPGQHVRYIGSKEKFWFVGYLEDGTALVRGKFGASMYSFSSLPPGTLAPWVEERNHLVLSIENTLKKVLNFVNYEGQTLENGARWSEYYETRHIGSRIHRYRDLQSELEEALKKLKDLEAEIK